MKAKGAVTPMDVVPLVVGADKSGIITSVNPAIEAAATGAVLESIRTNKLPYRFRVGS